MHHNDYIYIPQPDIPESIRCSVPMKDTRQLFVIDGKVNGTGQAFTMDLAEREEMKETLQIISVRTDRSPLALDFENNFHFGPGSKGKIALCSHTADLDHFITEETLNIRLEERAEMKLVVMQNEHDKAVHHSRFNIELAADTRFSMVVISLHGGEIQNRITVNLNGEHIDCDLSGLYLVDDEQKVTNRVELNHNVPNCKSNQLFKGILDDRSVGVFDGIIRVIKDAQKTEAYQANHNLLLSKKAKVHTQPHLEIYADDVKCSHGATIGRLNDEELFYMRARGISMQEAKLLQQMAFVYSVIDKISSEELKEKILQLTESRLRGEFSKCQNCSKNCC